MIIIDLRSRPERLLGRASDASGERPWHRVAGMVADALVRRRVAGRQAPPDDLLVVSIGNLRVGGTGKTPVVLALAGGLAARGIVGGVVVRGYRARDATPRRVAAGDELAGDEARLLAGRLEPAGWCVVQAADRVEGIAMVRRAAGRPRVVLLEDAHQSRRAGRHLDILIVDRWRRAGDLMQPEAGPTLPFGPYRETAAGAARAAVWLAEGVVPTDRAASALVGFQRKMVLAASDRSALDGGTVGLVCGLARPEQFELGCRELLPQPPTISVRLPDHGEYDDAVLQRLAALGERHGLRCWLTTAKDAVKLGARGAGDLPVLTAELAVSWTTTPTLPDLVEERLRHLVGASGR